MKTANPPPPTMNEPRSVPTLRQVQSGFVPILPALPARTWIWPLACALPQVALDACATSVAWIGAGILLRPGDPIGAVLPLGVLALGTPMLFSLLGLYQLPVVNPVRELRRLALGVSVMLMVATMALVLQLEAAPPRLFWQLVLGSGAGIVLAAWLRGALRRGFARIPGWGARVIVVGDRPNVDTVLLAIHGSPQTGLRPVLATGHYPSRDELSELGSREAAGWAIIAAQGLGAEQLSRLIALYEGALPHLVFVGATTVDVGETWDRRLQLGSMAGLIINTPSLTPTARMCRRTLSLAVIVPTVLLGAPLFALLALAVKLTSRGPAFYGQTRIGRGGKTFQAWKFRTMVRNADAKLAEILANDPEARAEWERDHKLRNDPRITPIGRFLRKTSLDELPQLWNILVGEMNLVGPRPIVADEVAKYGNAFALYKRVAPGLTGLWQVNGRNETTYDKRVRLDAFYVRNWSLWLDLYVLLRTVPVILRREGAM